MTVAVDGPNITIFNASDRFYMCRRKLIDLGELLEKISTKDDPGVMDLVEQYSLLRILTNKTSDKVENTRLAKKTRITERDLRNIERLEVLIHEFQSTLNEACQELLAA